MKPILIPVVAAAIMAGCSNAPRLQDGYQVGDVAGTAVDGTLQILTFQHRYCTESDPVARAILLRVILAAVPEYPMDGLCTDLLEALEAE